MRPDQTLLNSARVDLVQFGSVLQLSVSAFVPRVRGSARQAVQAEQRTLGTSLR